LDEEILEAKTKQKVSEAGLNNSNEMTSEYMEVMERLACLSEEVCHLHG